MGVIRTSNSKTWFYFLILEYKIIFQLFFFTLDNNILPSLPKEVDDKERGLRLTRTCDNGKTRYNFILKRLFAFFLSALDSNTTQFLLDEKENLNSKKAIDIENGFKSTKTNNDISKKEYNFISNTIWALFIFKMAILPNLDWMKKKMLIEKKLLIWKKNQSQPAPKMAIVKQHLIKFINEVLNCN